MKLSSGTIFVIVAVVILVLYAFISAYIAVELEKIPSSKAQIESLKKERDSLQHAIDASIKREQKYVLQIEADSIKAAELLTTISKRESKLKTYEQRIKEIQSIKIAQPDSFLIKRY